MVENTEPDELKIVEDDEELEPFDEKSVVGSPGVIKKKEKQIPREPVQIRFLRNQYRDEYPYDPWVN